LNFDITPHVQKIMRKYGVITLLFVAIILCLEYYGVISFGTTKLSFIPGVLWIYLFINVFSAGYSYYQIRNGNPVCPKCQSKLSEDIHYDCPHCGKLDFKELSRSQ
jgi:hypothetical protein